MSSYQSNAIDRSPKFVIKPFSNFHNKHQNLSLLLQVNHISHHDTIFTGGSHSLQNSLKAIQRFFKITSLYIYGDVVQFSININNITVYIRECMISILRNNIRMIPLNMQ